MSRFFAALYDPMMSRTEEACLRGWRQDLLAPLTGQVLEIGAGTGANLDAYGLGVERLVLTEPDPHMRARLAQRPRRAGLKAEIVDASADALPAPSATFDVVVSTLVLCSVPDVGRTLAEVKRVLRPGGSLVFLEHVAAEEGTSRHRWQLRLDPLWGLIAGNCHVTRRTGQAIEDAGFTFDRLERASMQKSVPIVRPTIRGVARLS